jgi:hypothetical protein
MKQSKELQTHCRIAITSIDLTTGERRELTQAEIAERMAKILAMDPVERVRTYFPTTEQKEPKS